MKKSLLKKKIVVEISAEVETETNALLMKVE